jgi:hypothetical protein
LPAIRHDHYDNAIQQQVFPAFRGNPAQAFGTIHGQCISGNRLRSRIGRCGNLAHLLQNCLRTTVHINPAPRINNANFPYYKLIDSDNNPGRPGESIHTTCFHQDQRSRHCAALEIALHTAPPVFIYSGTDSANTIVYPEMNL